MIITFKWNIIGIPESGGGVHSINTIIIDFDDLIFFWKFFLSRELQSLSKWFPWILFIGDPNNKILEAHIEWSMKTFFRKLDFVFQLNFLDKLISLILISAFEDDQSVIRTTTTRPQPHEYVMILWHYDVIEIRRKKIDHRAISTIPVAIRNLPLVSCEGGWPHSPSRISD